MKKGLKGYAALFGGVTCAELEKVNADIKIFADRIARYQARPLPGSEKENKKNN